MCQIPLEATDCLPSWNLHFSKRKTISKWIYNMMPDCHKCYKERLQEIPVIGAREPSHQCELWERHEKKGYNIGSKV